MWIVEVNVLGHRFTRRVHDHSGDPVFAPRLVPWRPRKPRSPRTAA